MPNDFDNARGSQGAHFRKLKLFNMPRTKKIKNSGLVDTSQVPKEIWANILKLADLTIRDVRKVAIVCKRWNEICRSDAFWNSN